MDASILIVEDDTAIRDSIHECFERQGYRVSSVDNAEEALEILASGDIQIVITDIMLPGMNGLELTHKIKQNYDIDVLVMTGYSENYSYEEAIHKGASDFVFKPFRFEELLLRLKRVIKERQITKERNRILSKLENLAITDGLTKLYNLVRPSVMARFSSLLRIRFRSLVICLSFMTLFSLSSNSSKRNGLKTKSLAPL